MKKLFNLLQRGEVAVMLVVLFVGAPSVITYTAKTYGNEIGFLVHMILIALSLVLSIFLFWSLTVKWNVDRLGHLIISCGAGFGGLLITMNMMMGIYQVIPPWLFGVFHNASFWLTTILAVLGAFVEWVLKPWNEDKGTKP